MPHIFIPFKMNSLRCSTDLCQQWTQQFRIIYSCDLWFLPKNAVNSSWNGTMWECMACWVENWFLVWECHIVIANNPSKWILYQIFKQYWFLARSHFRHNSNRSLVHLFNSHFQRYLTLSNASYQHFTIQMEIPEAHQVNYANQNQRLIWKLLLWLEKSKQSV